MAEVADRRNRPRNPLNLHAREVPLQQKGHFYHGLLGKIDVMDVRKLTEVLRTMGPQAYHRTVLDTFLKRSQEQPQEQARTLAAGGTEVGRAGKESMKLVTHGKRFYLICSHDERMVAKAAGFRYEPGLLGEHKGWYTESADTAFRLIQYADDETRAALQATAADFEIARPAEPDPETFGLSKARVHEIKRTNRFFLWVLNRSVTPDERERLASYDAAVSEYGRELARYKGARSRVELAEREALRKQENWWRSLDGNTFEEELCGFLQRTLAQDGYMVSKTGKAGDEGVDLTITKGDELIIVQCKAQKAPVGPAIIRDLYGSLVAHGAKEAWLVTTYGFSSGARSFAQGKPLRLVTIAELLAEGPPL